MAIARGSRVHFMGIGGIGMSGLANICLKNGCTVSGCNAKLNAMARRLQEQGAHVQARHDPAHLGEPLDVVV